MSVRLLHTQRTSSSWSRCKSGSTAPLSLCFQQLASNKYNLLAGGPACGDGGGEHGEPRYTQTAEHSTRGAHQGVAAKRCRRVRTGDCATKLKPVTPRFRMAVHRPGALNVQPASREMGVLKEKRVMDGRALPRAVPWRSCHVAGTPRVLYSYRYGNRSGVNGCDVVPTWPPVPLKKI